MHGFNMCLSLVASKLSASLFSAPPDEPLVLALAARPKQHSAAPRPGNCVVAQGIWCVDYVIAFILGRLVLDGIQEKKALLVT